MPDEASTLQFGSALAEYLGRSDIILLEGNLGAGKSTLARGILQGMGFAGEVASPTYAICLTYDPPETRLAVAHCDFYRLDAASEADELGLDDMAHEGVLIIEWPDKGPDWVGRSALTIHIETMRDNARRLTLTAGQAWKDRWQQIATI